MKTESTILVIDDHPLLRKGMAQLIEMDKEFSLIGEAANGEEGIELAARLKPDIILLDLNMKGMDGMQVLEQLKKAECPALIIVLTVSNNEQDLVAALSGGADGYLLKDMEPDDILSKLRNAAHGHIILDETLTGLLANSFRDKNGGNLAPTNRKSLTPREEQILDLISAGMSNKMIAHKLEISDGTVKVHVKNMLRKLNFQSRLQAAVWALNNRS